jgi:hypothetical protein
VPTLPNAAKLDVVIPARHLVAERGRLRLIGVGEPRITEDGISVGETVLRPTALADAGIAEKLGIPGGYLRRLLAQQIGLYDANVNTWLADEPNRRSVRYLKPSWVLGGRNTDFLRGDGNARRTGRRRTHLRYGARPRG